MPDRNQMTLNSVPWWNAIAGEWLDAGDWREDPDAELTCQHVYPPVLEVGCGVGSWAKVLAAKWPGVSYLGLDISKRMVDACRLRVPGHVFMNMDILQLPDFWHGSFYTAVAFQTLEHFEDPAPVLDKLKLLATRRLVFSVPRGMPGPASRQHNGHVFGWEDDAEAEAYLSVWGRVRFLPGRPEHIVGTVDWNQ